MEQSNIMRTGTEMVSRLSTGTKLVKTQSQFCAVITNTRTHTHTHILTNQPVRKVSCMKKSWYENIMNENSCP